MASRMKLSFLIPSRNRLGLLKQAVDSIRRQRTRVLQHWEEKEGYGASYTVAFRKG
jgi:hypothetical protein